MGVDNAMRHKHSLKQRKNDLYETPTVATHALANNVDLPRQIWEPACGRGAISKVLESRFHDVVSTDLLDYGYGVAGRDFLLEQSAPDGFDCIVTNPPYKLASEFAAHAIRLAPKVYMLLRLAFLEAGDASAKNLARRERAFALDGGRLSRVLVFANRLPMMHRDDWAGNNANSGTAFAWFCWEADHHGLAHVQRIRWSE